jgi:hypothetical protein
MNLKLCAYLLHTEFQKVILIVFICSLFNDANSNSDYVASNNLMAVNNESEMTRLASSIPRMQVWSVTSWAHLLGFEMVRHKYVRYCKLRGTESRYRIIIGTWRQW